MKICVCNESVLFSHRDDVIATQSAAIKRYQRVNLFGAARTIGSAKVYEILGTFVPPCRRERINLSD